MENTNYFTDHSRTDPPTLSHAIIGRYRGMGYAASGVWLIERGVARHMSVWS